MNFTKIFIFLIALTNKLYSAEVVFECDVINFSDRKIEIYQNNASCIKKILYAEIIKGEKHFTLKIKINKPDVIFFNDYLFYVHPTDTVKLFYQRLYSTGYDSLFVSGRNSSYYLFFYELKKNRPISNYREKNSSDSLWIAYKAELKKNQRAEMSFLKKYVSRHNLSKIFYFIASNEIKYQYIINSLLPNYGIGFNKNDSSKIPSEFYKDISDKEFYNGILSNTYISAIDLYNKYLVDNQTGHKMNRYSAEYLSELYDMANKVFRGIPKKVLLLRILNEYQVIGLEAYLSVYKKISEKIHKQYDDLSTLNYVDSLYNLFVVLNKPFPENIKNTMLTDMSGNKISFGDIINKYRGKVIYADFWATWCIPCIKEMPNSILMQTEYSGKDIVFIFLSLDFENSISLWNRTSKQLKIESGQYLVDDSFDSNLSNFINVGAIPVYFIVDKKGNLVSKSAPRPNTDEVRKIIDRLLLE